MDEIDYESIEMGAVCIVGWNDAGGNNEAGWQTFNEFMEDTKTYPVKSCGFYLFDDEEYLYLVSDYSWGRDEDDPSQHHSVNSIPKGCIESLLVQEEHDEIIFDMDEEEEEDDE